MTDATDDFHKLSHEAHERHYDSERAASKADAWGRENTVDAWRHARMYGSLDPLLTSFPGAKWMTVGDGRFGTDAHYLLQKGADALATDISDTMLKRASERGFIREYRRENAEQLSCADGSFDFVLCKESYHHFPRPMLAVYEMLRVARRGVVLIEPDETPLIKSPAHILKMLGKAALIRLGFGARFADRSTGIIDFGTNRYEDVGNFAYAITRREMERVALGLNYPQVAFLDLNDAYLAGVENESADEKSKLFREVRWHIDRLDRLCRRGLNLHRPKLLVAVIFKQELERAPRAALAGAGFEIRDLPRNPYLGKPAST